MPRSAGLSVRLRLTLSYAALVVIAGILLLATVWLFLLRYVPQQATSGIDGFHPGRGDLQRAFFPWAALAMVALPLFGAVGGWFLAGRVLEPLTRLTEATRLAAAGSLSHRVALDGPSDEFRELADSFDDMLARIEANVAEQQRFAANASHELRTPLAITQTMLEVARQEPAADPVDLLDRLYAVNSRAIGLTEALLLLSRADRRAFAPEPVDLSLLAEEAAETLLPLAEGRGVRITSSVEPAPARGSRALLQQLATNLLHNAIVHNRPDHGVVWMSTRVSPHRVELLVENTGPQLDRDALDTLVEPFQRGADRARADHGGVGLGLAIVASIVRAHDGDLRLTARPEGGLAVSAALPGAAR